MDAESLKIILHLTKENIELRQAIEIALYSLSHKEVPWTPEPTDESARWLLDAIRNSLMERVYTDHEGNETNAPYNEDGSPRPFRWVKKTER